MRTGAGEKCGVRVNVRIVNGGKFKDRAGRGL